MKHPTILPKDIEKMLVWWLLWISGVGGQMDMKDTLFAFPTESLTSYVELSPAHHGPLGEVTVCMRFHSNLTREYALFSLATRNRYNAFLLFYYSGSRNQFLLSVDNKDQNYELQAWVVWIDGKAYKTDGFPDVKISDELSIIIGQEQDRYKGGFNASESFVGEVTDINMWDKALTEENMMDYFAANEISGNILNWNALRYTIHGDVKKSPYADPYPCIPV
ncbi:hypothetical protein GDO78_010236 [Eleutherodactylus coqui]|uniref:Pentraxin (PTX) domain-containing protein n=1 Tax=Eleutherodactylus coqui TaxID=57060 RepID=A0A8J6F5B5_ELECQ|nr:hypothetical protein GDO78_010236 [Eleutherodactylus coqui]